MKKKMLLLPLIALGLAIPCLTLAGSNKIIPVYAETTETESEVESETTETTETEEELTEEGFVDQTKAFLSKYLDEQLVIAIINWAIDIGLLSALFGVYLKYRKYKSKSSTEIAEEVKAKVQEAVADKMNELTKEEIEKIYKVVDKINEGLITTNKALVLAQDKSAEGKIALLNLISEKSEDESVKETADEVKTKIKDEEKLNEEVNEEVKDDYKGIF